MKCPYCEKTNTRVLDKRDDHSLGVMRRRRECEICRKRFTTFERVELIHLVVLKKNGTRQVFDRSKVMSGVLSATWKRGIAQERLELLVNEIELELRKRETLEIPSIEIGNMVMKKLKELDNVAYIRSASIYRAFADVGDFQRELSMLLHSQPVVAT